MSTIVFPNGKRVKFNGTPSPSDVDYVAKQIGITSETKPEPTLMDKLKGVGTAYVDYQKNQANNALGVLEGATLGIPRAVVEQTVGRGVGALTGDKELQDKLMNLPRGSQGGQLIGSFMGLGELSKVAKAIPALAGSGTMANLLRGSATGAVAANTPLFTPKDDSLEDRAKRTALGAGLGGVAEAAAPLVGKAAQATGNFLKKTPRLVKSVFESGKNLQKAEAAAEDIYQSIENLRDAKSPALQDLIESSADDAIKYKNALRPISKQNSKIYGEALDKIESQVTLTQSKLKSIIDDTINEALDAGVPNDSPVLSRIKQVGEKYGSKTESYFDDLRGSMTRTIDEPLSVNDLKQVKNEIFKVASKEAEGSDDVANAIFMKNYGREIASQSSDFAKLQSEYAPYLEAKKWAYRTFKPFTKDEIPNGNRVLKAIAQGKGKLEDFEYLKRLEQGSGRFKGTGSMREQSQSMADNLQKISEEIKMLRRKSVKTKAEIGKLKALVNFRNWSTGLALSALGLKAVNEVGKNVSGVLN